MIQAISGLGSGGLVWLELQEHHQAKTTPTSEDSLSQIVAKVSSSKKIHHLQTKSSVDFSFPWRQPPKPCEGARIVSFGQEFLVKNHGQKSWIPKASQHWSFWIGKPLVCSASHIPSVDVWGLEAKEPRELEPPEPGCRGFGRVSANGQKISKDHFTECPLVN